MKEITEDYVSFETAKLLKEKGFNEDCNKVYINGNLQNVITKESIKECPHCYNSWLYVGDAAAPTQSLAMRWLREKHNIHIDIFVGGDCSDDADGNIVERWYFWSYNITNLCGNIIYDAYGEFDCTEYQTYEEASEAALKYVLENLI